LQRTDPAAEHDRYVEIQRAMVAIEAERRAMMSD
jgi:hypothetical protein